MPEQIKTALQELLAAYFEIQLGNPGVYLTISGNTSGYISAVTPMEARDDGF